MKKILSLTLLYLFISLFCSIGNTVDLCKQFTEKSYKSKMYLKEKKFIDDSLLKFANSKEIATLADSLLTEFINAKSPTLFSWLKTRNFENEKEEIIATQWRLYFAKNFILADYPTKDNTINQLIINLNEDIAKFIFNKSYKTKLEKVFSKIQELSIKKINSYPIEIKIKTILSKKITKIKLHWLVKFEDSNFRNHPLEFLDWGFAYDPTHNSINIGVHALNYPFNVNLDSILAHEIGHAFDSCRWTQENPKIEWPFKKVGNCLRSEASINAKLRDDNLLEQEFKKGKISDEVYSFLKNNLTCNKSNYPPIGTQSDQLPETFADWFSAEVMSEIKKVSENVRYDLCENNHINPGSSYISNSERLFGIYYSNPILKSKLGNKILNTKIYCDIN